MKKAAIIGTGSAGCSAAIFLQRQGYHVELFEKVKKPTSVGAGIMLQLSGLNVLKSIGLYDEALKYGLQVRLVHGVNQKGKKVIHLDYEDIHKDCFGLGIHRGTLFELCHKAVEQQSLPIHCGVQIVATEETADKVSIKDTEGNDYGPYDLVVAADGARSQLRAQVAGPWKNKKYTWGALWTCVPNESSLSNEVLYQAYKGTKKMVGFLPTGKLYNDTSGKDYMSVFWSIKLSEVDKWRNSDINNWKESVVDLAPESSALLEGINHHDDFILAPYFDVRMWPWHKGRVVVIGDAAHPMSPQMSQGANMGLMDAWVLNECISEYSDVKEALNEYSFRRRKHVIYYQNLSHWVKYFFQSSNNPLFLVRDPLFRVLSELPFSRKIMMDSFLGYKTGLFSKS